MNPSDGSHTLGRWLSDSAANHAAKVAIDDRGVTITYAELERRSSSLAEALLAAGYGPRDRVATLTGNSVDHVVVFFACAKAGLTLVPISWRLTTPELADCLEAADPDLVLVEDLMASSTRAALHLTPLGRHTTGPRLAMLGTTGVEADVPLRRSRRSAEPARAVRDDDPLLVIFTSGSEARPKGVVLTHANCFWNNLSLARVLDISSSDVVLAMLPQFHVAAWNVQPLLALWHGATVVLERTFEPSRVLQLIHQRRVTTLMAVPTQYHLLASEPGFDAADLSSVRTAIVGGSAMPESALARWAEHGVTIAAGYGLTEASPNVLIASKGSAARPYPYVEVRITDPVTDAVLTGAATGELEVRGPGVFAGYLDDPVATERTMHDGWLRTGDLASRDTDGGYRIVDRIKNIYISGGENVSPAEVEAVLVSHPFVEDAAVLGVPDPVWGEVGVAFVVPRSGAALTDTEVLEHASSHLARFKVPRNIHVVEELPRTALGKVARAQLRDSASNTEGPDHERS